MHIQQNKRWSTDLNIALEGGTGVVSCLARIPDGPQLLHHDPCLAYHLLCGASLVLWDVVRHEEGGLLSTHQWICEGHSVSSGILFLLNQSLRRCHILGHPAGRRFPTLSALQRFLILIIIRESDNNIGWSYREESGLEIMSQSTKNGVKNIVPGFEVAASSISWSSARAEVSEVAALQLQRISRLTSASTRDKVHAK